MNLLLRIILIAGVGTVAQFYFPWWTVVLVALVIELILGRSKGTAFFAGFYGVSVPWMVLATYLQLNTDSDLVIRILRLFSLPEFPFIIIVLTGLIGGTAGGVGSLTGRWIRMVFISENG